MEYEENERRLKASTDAQKKFEEAVAATVPLMDKLKILGAELITALQPAFEILTAVADTMIDFLKGMDTGTKSAVVGVVALGAAFLTMAPLLSAGSTFLAGITAMPAIITGIGTDIRPVSPSEVASSFTHKIPVRVQDASGNQESYFLLLTQN